VPEAIASARCGTPSALTGEAPVSLRAYLSEHSGRQLGKSGSSAFCDVTVCRGSVDLACDPLESCDGSGAVCPADQNTCVSLGLVMGIARR